LEITVGFGSVVVSVPLMFADTDPSADDFRALDHWVASLVASLVAPLSDTDTDTDTDHRRSRPTERVVEIPVVFDGNDLNEVAARLDMDPVAVADILLGNDLNVAFLGFSPGFPYLVGLPDSLASLERRSTPRTHVPAGSVAVAGGFASVYPQSTPGGWHLLGHTDMPLFDPNTPPYAALRPGDTVRFRRAVLPHSPLPSPTPPTSPTAAARLATGRNSTSDVPPPSWPPDPAAPFIRVLEPGLFTLIQDAGRRSLSGIGIPPAGPADPRSMVLANRLVGNDDWAPALEITARGPTLEIESPVHLAVVGDRPGGVEITVDGHAVGSDTVVPIARGQTVIIGTIHGGLRAYAAFTGGIDGPVSAGSRASDVLSGLGPGPLTAGDRMTLGPSGHPHGLLLPEAALTSSEPHHRMVRLLGGPTPSAPTELDRLTGTTWTVGIASNRIGLRLESADVVLRPPASGIPSTGMLTGAIQLPPDGKPIVLLPDHATTGGYPVIATVITADLGVVGQAAPGDVINFQLVDLDRARGLFREMTRDTARRVSGWFPTQSGT